VCIKNRNYLKYAFLHYSFFQRVLFCHRNTYDDRGVSDLRFADYIPAAESFKMLILFSSTFSRSLCRAPACYDDGRRFFTRSTDTPTRRDAVSATTNNRIRRYADGTVETGRFTLRGVTRRARAVSGTIPRIRIRDGAASVVYKQQTSAHARRPRLMITRTWSICMRDNATKTYPTTVSSVIKRVPQ